MVRHRPPGQQRKPPGPPRPAPGTPKAGPMSTSISNNHRRGVASTLGLLDEMLCRFEQWMHCQPAEGVLYRQSDTLTAEQKVAIQIEIDALREMMKELRDDLRLEVRTENIGTAIWAHISAFWEALVELKAKSLRRYGDVSDGLAEYLDPRIEQMIERMMLIADVARRSKADGYNQRERRARGTTRGATKTKTEGQG